MLKNLRFVPLTRRRGEMLEVLLVEDDDKDARILEGYLERFAAETGLSLIHI